MKESIFSRLLKYALYAAFAVGVAGTVSLPFTLNYYVRFVYGGYGVPPYYVRFALPAMLLLALLCLWIVAEMILMMRSIGKGPFVMRNVRALCRTGVVFLVLSLAFIVLSVVRFTPLTFFCIFLFAAAGLFSFTLADLIRQAVVFREENDLTI